MQDQRPCGGGSRPRPVAADPEALDVIDSAPQYVERPSILGMHGSQLRPVAELDGSGAVVARFECGTRINVPDYMVRAGTHHPGHTTPGEVDALDDSW